MRLLAGHESVGNLLSADSSLGDIQHELKGVVIIETDWLAVDIEEDCRCQPSQALVAINQPVVRDYRGERLL